MSFSILFWVEKILDRFCILFLNKNDNIIIFIDCNISNLTHIKHDIILLSLKHSVKIIQCQTKDFSITKRIIICSLKSIENFSEMFK